VTSDGFNPSGPACGDASFEAAAGWGGASADAGCDLVAHDGCAGGCSGSDGSGWEKLSTDDTNIPPAAGCFDALESATCEELADLGGAARDVCFPPCPTRVAFCQGDQITQCTEAVDGNLRTMTSDCRKICEFNGGSYTGVCFDS
jgi:hypothetical protein